MKFNLEIEDPNEFNINYKDFEHYSIFADINFLSVFADVFNCKLRLINAYKRSTLLASFPVFIKKKYGLKYITRPPLLYYQDILLTKKITKKDYYLFQLNMAYSDFIKRNFNKVFISFHPSYKDIRGFSSSNFNVNPVYTYLIDLKNNQMDEYESDKRNRIRKAKKNNIIIKKDSDFSYLLKIKKKFYGSDVPLGLQKQLLEELHLRNKIDIFNAFYENKIISSKVVIKDKKNKFIYAWMGRNNKNYLFTGVSTYFTYKILDMYRDKFDYFDFCGCNILKIARFKSGFPTKLKHFYQVNWSKLSNIIPGR